MILNKFWTIVCLFETLTLLSTQLGNREKSCLVSNPSNCASRQDKSLQCDNIHNLSFLNSFKSFLFIIERPTPEGICQKMDIIFVLDRSASIRKDDYEHMRHFLESIGKTLKIGERDENGQIIGQGAIITFSEKGTLRMSLKESNKPGEFLKLIYSMPGPLRGGRTKTHKGLDVADKQVASKAGGLRLDDPDVKKILMVITDGEQTVESRRRGW
jgi:hypothetical protein